jgi:hypothetical protein
LELGTGFGLERANGFFDAGVVAFFGPGIEAGTDKLVRMTAGFVSFFVDVANEAPGVPIAGPVAGCTAGGITAGTTGELPGNRDKVARLSCFSAEVGSFPACESEFSVDVEIVGSETV